jgi:hypothetical protein
MPDDADRAIEVGNIKVNLDKVDNAFEKVVEIPGSNKVLYQFIVDGEAEIDHKAPLEPDADEILFHVLVPPDEYPYQKLDFDTHEIRILHLEPASADDTEIRCSLKHVSLIDPGPFIALSYCWGDTRITKSINLGGHSIEITTNLDSALRAICKRRVQIDREGRRKEIKLWVDALCINQDDNLEKSQQVRNMRQIYSRAEEVIAWVGTANSPSSITPLDFLNIAMQYKAGDDMATFSARPDDTMQALYASVDKFFAQPYWRRVWVIQEITVALNVQFFYVDDSDIELSWKDVSILLTTLQSLLSIMDAPCQAFKSALHLLEFRKRFFIDRDPIRLQDALWSSKDTLATDPRDKIFALLGICHDWATFVPVPNYKQSLGSIIAEMSKAMMVWHNSLDLICLKGHQSLEKQIEGLPTWAPNLPNFWFGGTTIQERNILLDRSTGSSNPLLGGSNNVLIKVTGSVIGIVSEIAPSMLPYHRGQETIQRRSPWISSTYNLHLQIPELARPSPDDVKFKEYIWNTLMMAQYIPNFDSTIYETCFSLLWKPLGRGAVHNLDLIQWIDNVAWFKIGHWTLREWSQVRRSGITPDALGLTRASRSTLLEGNMDKFIERLDDVLGSGMRLASLENESQTICMAHPHTKQGDLIVFLRGCSMPVVLRRQDNSVGASNLHKNRFRVIGAAYLHGVMQDWGEEITSKYNLMELELV